MSSPNGSTISPNSKTRSELNRPIQLNPALHAAAGDEALSSVKLTFTPSYTRHNKQLDNGKIAQLNTLSDLLIDATEYCVCYEVDPTAQKALSLNKEPIFQSHLYLFSVLIAFEWQPSAQTVQRMQLAAKKASDFLYDVTDGFMAIGQVILCGRDLLDVADIQVMASNRFHPRSWISALHEPQKYQPIRLGRGLWRKDQGFLVPWDESDSHRVLVHEWGHYALELVDEYLDLVQLDRNNANQLQWRANLAKNPILRGQNPNSLDIVAPSIALPVDSIMSTLASSELIPRHGPQGEQRWNYMLTKIQKHFPKVAPPKPLEGPAELPLPNLPMFKQSPSNNQPEEILLTAADLSDLRSRIIAPNTPYLDFAGSSWVYVLQLKRDRTDQVERVIGQGIISARDWDEGFALLGAVVGDQVVVVSQIADTGKTPYTSQVKVMRGDITDDKPGVTRHASWSDATPDALPDFIDVLPLSPGQDQLPTHLRVQIEIGRIKPSDSLPEVLVAALGEAPQLLTTEDQTYPVCPDDKEPHADGRQRRRWISKPVTLNHLDGHILLRWENGKKLYACNFSHGGGPCTGGGGYCVCYTAGSYEGNSMVFYRDNYDASDRTTPLLTGVAQISDEGTRIVSTVMHGGPQYIQVAPDILAEARSYIFSLGSNQPLNKHSATLVLYYDDDARKHGGDLLIYRWNECDGWQRLTTYAPENRPYLCIPLDEQTRETSGGTNGRTDEYFDRYRIYWTPRYGGHERQV